MKKLIRSAKPLCLNNYQHGVHNWAAVTPVDKQDVWKQFDVMQYGFCAYCECFLTGKHIEHFKDKDSSPRETFEWRNLFGSCDESNRCGHYKDSRKAKPYNISDILKPDTDNVNDYLIYLTNGNVVARSGLTQVQKFRATETIRVFNLNGDTSIVNRRKTSFRNIKVNVDTLYEMISEFDDVEWLALLKTEIDDLKNCKVEFQTAMEHAWRYNKQFV
tara:strand:- start:4882 stop:5532 length:651 start_codon:yes stop_codon:yes gene_type:complete